MNAKSGHRSIGYASSIHRRVKSGDHIKISTQTDYSNWNTNLKISAQTDSNLNPNLTGTKTSSWESRYARSSSPTPHCIIESVIFMHVVAMFACTRAAVAWISDAVIARITTGSDRTRTVAVSLAREPCLAALSTWEPSPGRSQAFHLQDACTPRLSCELQLGWKLCRRRTVWKKKNGDWRNWIYSSGRSLFFFFFVSNRSGPAQQVFFLSFCRSPDGLLFDICTDAWFIVSFMSSLNPAALRGLYLLVARIFGINEWSVLILKIRIYHSHERC